MRVATFVCIGAALFSITPPLSAQCAPVTGAYQPPSDRTYNICVRQEHLVISTSSIENAAALWGSGCAQVGSGVPNIVANPQSALSCDIDIGVSFNPDPHPSLYSAVFNWSGSTATNPPTLTGGQIVCYVEACSDLLLAHEIGHALGLDNATQSACAGTIMMEINPGSDFSDACNVADTIWLGPAPSDPDPNAPDGDCDRPPGDDPATEPSEGGTDDCYQTPLIFNLDRGPYKLTGVEEGVQFDMNGDGVTRQVSWTAPATLQGFLSLDRNANGRIDDGSELFGSHTPLLNGSRAKTGFEALAALDENRDGVIDSTDRAWSALQIWIDYDHDGVSQPAELLTMHAAGIVSLSYDAVWTGRRDPNGNLFAYLASYQATRGYSTYYDVYLRSR